jgi:Zn-dependent protease
LPENHDCPQIEIARLPKEDLQPLAPQGESSYGYTVTSSQLRAKGRVRFSQKEIQHLAAAAFLVVGVGMSMVLFPTFFYGSYDIDYVMLTLFTAIFTISFFVHEIAHKTIAQRYGLWAEFRMTTLGSILTMISMFSPIKFISPGAVMVSGYDDKQMIGKISIAGPLTNIVLSTTFLAAGSVAPPPYESLLILGSAFNAWIALFNLIPFGVFDGLKVFLWDRRIWALGFAASLILTLISYHLIM